MIIFFVLMLFAMWNELLFNPTAVGSADVYLVDNKVDGTRISDKDAVGGLHLGIHILHEA